MTVIYPLKKFDVWHTLFKNHDLYGGIALIKRGIFNSLIAIALPMPFL